MMKPLITVCGSDADDEHLTAKALATAESVGRLIAQHNAVLVCGGRGGIMRAACKGAKEAGGQTVGILQETKDEANEFVDIGLPTGLGTRRNILVANVGDVLIAIGGRWGTLSEVSFAMIFKKPVILIEGTGGCVDGIIQHNLLCTTSQQYHVVHSAEEAVDLAFRLINP